MQNKLLSHPNGQLTQVHHPRFRQAIPQRYDQGYTARRFRNDCQLGSVVNASLTENLWSNFTHPSHEVTRIVGEGNRANELTLNPLIMQDLDQTFPQVRQAVGPCNHGTIRIRLEDITYVNAGLSIQDIGKGSPSSISSVEDCSVDGLGIWGKLFRLRILLRVMHELLLDSLFERAEL